MTIKKYLKRHSKPVEILRNELQGEFGDEGVMESKFSIEALIQPLILSSNLADQGFLTKDQITIYTKYMLQTADDGKEPDIIMHDDKTYKVISIQNWETHYEVIAERMHGR